MAAADGVPTVDGDRTSHAVVVARGLGKTAIVGCDGLLIEYGERACVIGGREIPDQLVSSPASAEPGVGW